MSDADPGAAVRVAAGLVSLPDRGLVEVHGEDRRRWLEGQLSHEVGSLAPDGPRTGRYALLLTPQGRIVADVHVIARPACYWLEMAAAAVPAALERLDRYLVADAVELLDRSESVARLALEGRRSRDVLEAAIGAPPPALDLHDAAVVEIAGTPVVAGAWSASGEPGLQLFVPPSAQGAVLEALLEAGAPHGLEPVPPEALEVLRVEAGTPRFGSEIGPDVLPADVGLDRQAVSFTKGCYTGQEIVARMRTHDRAKRRLVGLRPVRDERLVPGVALEREGRRVGRVTSAVRSPRAGSIALALVERAHAEPGTALRAEGAEVHVHELPFVKPAAAEPGGERSA